MNLLLLGVSHRTAPVDLREKLDFSSGDVGAAVQELATRASVPECVVLSTCNRSEVYVANDNLERTRRDIIDFLGQFHGLPADAFSEHLFALEGREAVEHLFRVAAGLDSALVGEPQILGQVKDASELAARLGGAGPVTERLLDMVLRSAKRARAETGIGRGPVSITYAGVSLAAKVLGNLGVKRALLVGAGEMSALAWTHLRDAGVTQFMVANRSRERGEAFGEKYAARVVSLEALPVVLPGADLVVCATRAPGTVISESMVRAAMKIRRNRPLFCLDLAVPRDIEPQVARLENVFLHDLDALGQIVGQSLAQRRAEIPRVETIIEEELSRFLKWHRALSVKPTVTAFRHHFERIAAEELARHRGRFRPEDVGAAESLAHGIVQKLLHRPTTILRDAEEGGLDSATRLDTVRDLFGIEGEDDAAAKDEPAGQGGSDADRNAR